MPDITELEAFLAPATVADEVFSLRPDYRALLIAQAVILWWVVGRRRAPVAAPAA